MEKKEQLWERLAPIVLEREDGFGNITVGGATDQQGKDNLLNFISQEIEKAKREAQIEVLTEIFQTCYQEDSKTLELVEEKLSKLTTK